MKNRWRIFSTGLGEVANGRFAPCLSDSCEAASPSRFVPLGRLIDLSRSKGKGYLE